MLNTTVGQLLLNDALPPELRDYSRQLTKEQVGKLMQEVAERFPEQYGAITNRLMDTAKTVAYRTGGYSFGLEHLKTTKVAQAARMQLQQDTQKILSSDMSADEKRQAILTAADKVRTHLSKSVYDEALAAKNPLAMQVAAGARGNPAQLNKLIGGDILYVDHRDEPIPFPVTQTYSEGLSPAEYFAGSFGARKGLVDVKLGTARAGFFAKQLNQVAHRLLTTAIDDDDDPDNPAPAPSGVRGLPVDTDDEDSVGALLASTVGPYARNTTITPRVLADLKNKGINRILVRSPLVGGPPGGGVYARDVGIRERGGLAPLGDMVGMAAAQALSERLTQGSLGSKHSGGVKGAAKAAGGFEYLNALIQAQEHFKGVAAHSQVDGTVEKIEPSPTGGFHVHIAGEKHFVMPGYNVAVKPGDTVEAGDVISDGVPHPAQVLQHKGIGEGRRYFVQAFKKAFKDAGMYAHRRNVELVARGLMDHVEMQDDTEDHVPGDVMPYQQLERTWKPRQGYQTVAPTTAVGQYLERPTLHYTIGTQIKKSMLPEFQHFGVNKIDVHAEPPPFKPVMIRAMDSIGHDQDFLTRLLGSYQKRSLLDAVHRGRTSDTKSTSFVPAMAEGTSFGKTWPQSILKPP